MQQQLRLLGFQDWASFHADTIYSCNGYKAVNEMANRDWTTIINGGGSFSNMILYFVTWPNFGSNKEQAV